MYFYCAEVTPKCTSFLLPPKPLLFHHHNVNEFKTGLNSAQLDVKLRATSARLPNGLFVFSMMARSSSKSKQYERDSSITDGVNAVLSSSRIAAVFVSGALLGYLLSAFSLAKMLSGIGNRLMSHVAINLRTGRASMTLAPHHRITLVALAILLPDFRYVLGAYAEAVRALRIYRSPMGRFPFALPNRHSIVKRDRDSVGHEAYNRLASESVTSTRSQSRPQTRTSHDHQNHNGYVSAKSPVGSKQYHSPFVELKPQIPRWLATRARLARQKMHQWQEQKDSWLRQVFAPAREKAVQLQHLATRSDLTLRKDVSIAAGSIILSLIGYTVASTADVNLAALIVVMANLAPSILLSRFAAPRHELLALVRDARISVAIVAALTSALSVFRPLIASYIFLLCCVLLVVTRDPVAWMRNLWNWR